MKAIVTVNGKDHKEIVPHITRKLTDFNVHIIDIPQTIVDNRFSIFIVVEFHQIDISYLQEEFNALAKNKNYRIYIHTKDTYESMIIHKNTEEN